MSGEENRNSAWAARRWPIALTWFCWATSASLGGPVPACPDACECWETGGEGRTASCVDVGWRGSAYPEVRVVALRPAHAGAQCTVPKQLALLFPRLRAVLLRDCALSDVPENRLPAGLKRLDLSGNRLVDVPAAELRRLNALERVDVGSNPIRCNCRLEDLRNRLAERGTVLHARCASPARYAGYSLAEVPPGALCDVEEQQLDDEGDDDFLFNVQIGRVVGEEGGHRHSRRSVNHTSPAEMSEVPSNEGSGDEGLISTVEGSGDADDTTSTNVATVSISSTSQPTNESIARLSSALANSTDAVGRSGQPATPIQPSVTRSSSQDASTRPPPDTASDIDSNATETAQITLQNVSSDAGRRTTTEQQPDSTAPAGINAGADGDPVPTTTNLQSSSVSGGSTSAAPSASAKSDEADTSHATSTSSSSSSPPGSATFANVDDSVNNVMSVPPQPPSSVRDAAPIPSDSADDQREQTPSSTTTSQQSQQQLQNETQLPDAGEKTVARPNVSTAVWSGVHDDESTKTAVPEDTEPMEDAGGDGSSSGSGSRSDGDGGTRDGDTNSTAGQPIQGQMTKNERVESATSTPYIIPSLLIVAVALVCLAIYFSQHNCRTKGWSGTDGKASGPATELHDVSLLRTADGQHSPSDLYSKRYEATEGRNAQTEKLTNGDRDLPPERNGTALDGPPSPSSRQHPALQKRTARVTNNYESVPKTPIVIHKS